MKATHATHAQTHHQAPVVRMNQQTASTSGVPSATASARPLAMSAAKVAGVVWLKPWRASMPKVRQASNGREATAPTARKPKTVARSRA